MSKNDHKNVSPLLICDKKFVQQASSVIFAPNLKPTAIFPEKQPETSRGTLKGKKLVTQPLQLFERYNYGYLENKKNKEERKFTAPKN